MQKGGIIDEGKGRMKEKDRTKRKGAGGEGRWRRES